jgi:hypothetical protein|tara:strand:+ start:366 stop:1076 length:711 start_codon:yes stop_codon:yes gene_type:complete
MYALVPMTHDEIVANLEPHTITELRKELHTRIYPHKRDRDKGRPFQIAKEAWEYALADATAWNGGEWAGHGNAPEDVRVGDKKYDVKGLGGKWTSTSGEASVKQSLSASARIDESFLENDSKNLWAGIVTPWIEKINTGGEYYVTVFWRHKETLAVRLVMFRLDTNNLPEYTLDSCEFNKTNTQMIINNIVDPEQAKLYILRSKHRMELRIKGSYFNADPSRYVDVYDFGDDGLPK